VFSKDARPWQKDLVPATAANKKKLRKFLDALKGEPYTNLWSGLKAALNLETGSYATRQAPSIDELFLLSDGAPTIGEVTDEEEILKLVTETNRFAKVRINTVFIGSTPSGMDPLKLDPGEGQSAMGPEELMKRIAEQNGGRYVFR
jgi:hypothetical protein